jgi:hypothetical protein
MIPGVKEETVGADSQYRWHLLAFHITFSRRMRARSGTQPQQYPFRFILTRKRGRLRTVAFQAPDTPPGLLCCPGQR